MDLLLTSEAKLTNTFLQTLPPHIHNQISPNVTTATDPTPKSQTADRLQALLQMQKTDPSACGYPNTKQMEKILSTKLISS